MNYLNLKTNKESVTVSIRNMDKEVWNLARIESIKKRMKMCEYIQLLIIKESNNSDEGKQK